MNLQEAYKELGIPSSSSKDDAKKAFKNLAKKFHPDAENGDEAKFKKINEAWQLIDSGRSAGPSQPSYESYGQPFDISDFINMNPFGNFSKQRQVRDIQVNQKISFVESVLGCTKGISFKRSVACQQCGGEGYTKIHNGCKECNGFGLKTVRNQNMIYQSQCGACRGKNSSNKCNCNDGSVDSQTSVDVSIPAGILDKTKLRLSGIGDFAGNFNFQQYGNVILNINVEENKDLFIENNDVIHKTNISLLDSLKGKSIMVPTIDGEKQIDIPPKSKNKDEIIMNKLGVARQGNQKVIINVDLPENIDNLVEFLEKN